VQASIPSYIHGDTVRVLDDIAKVHELQKAGPGWVDDMVLVCGPDMMPHQLRVYVANMYVFSLFL